MHDSMSGSGLNKILPGFDLALLLMLMLFGLSGLGKLTAKTDLPPGGVSHPQLTWDEMEHQLAAMTKQNEGLQERLEKKEAEASRLDKELVRAKAHKSGNHEAKAMLATAREMVRKLRNEVEHQKRVLRDLQRRSNELKKGEALVRNMHRDLERQTAILRQFEEQNKALSEEIARVQRDRLKEQVIRVESTPLISLMTNRKPVYVALANGTVSPIRKPFYNMQHKIEKAGKGQFERVVVASTNRRGETVEMAFTGGSAFSKALRDINPGHEYVALLVDSRSFETFRAVREVLRKRGIPFGWEPSVSSRIRFSADGQIIPEEID